MEYGFVFKDNAIASYVNNETYSLFEDLIEIKDAYPSYTFNLTFDNNTSNAIRTKIVEKMRDIIMHYYYSYKASTIYKRTKEHKLFLKLLIDFNESHKNFGRKMFKKTKNGFFRGYYNI